MTKVRPVQSSMFPDIQPDKPTGKILPSVFQGTNADLMAAVAPFYLTGSVCDVTYGEGKWWDRYKPDPFTAHDKFKLDGVDFTALPEADDTYDTVCFDPPYVAQGGINHGGAGVAKFRDAYGIDQEVGYGNEEAHRDLVLNGLRESARVVRPDGWLLVKCMEFVSSREWHNMPYLITQVAIDAGLRSHDVIVHHSGSGPGGHNIYDPIRARRHHSYLLVFRKAPR